MLHVPPPAAGALAFLDLVPVLRRLQGMLKAEQRAVDAAAMAAEEEEDATDGMFGYADNVAGNLIACAPALLLLCTTS